MEFIGKLFLLIVFYIVSWFAAGEFFTIAEDKGYHDKKYFWWTFLILPVGALLIVAMPDRGMEQRAVVNDDLPDL